MEAFAVLSALVVCLLIGTACGVVLALAMGFLPVTRRLILPVMVVSQAIPVFAIAPRCSGVMPGAGASSTTFWWRRCSEQSRSPSTTTAP